MSQEHDAPREEFNWCGAALVGLIIAIVIAVLVFIGHAIPST